MFGALAVVGQHVVGGGDFLEPVGRFLIPGIDVGMQLLCQPTIGAFDRIQIRATVDAEKVIGVHGVSFVRLTPPVNRQINFILLF